MKKLQFLLCALLLLGFTSCSSDDGNDVNSSMSNALLGTWRADSGDGGSILFFTFKENGECVYEEVTYYNDYLPATAHMKYSFDANSELLRLELLYVEDLSKTFAWMWPNERGEFVESWTLKIISSDKFIIPHIYRNGALFEKL